METRVIGQPGRRLRILDQQGTGLIPQQHNKIATKKNRQGIYKRIGHRLWNTFPGQDSVDPGEELAASGLGR